MYTILYQPYSICIYNTHAEGLQQILFCAGAQPKVLITRIRINHKAKETSD